MTDILQMLSNLHTLLAPLLRNLVTDTPHDDARMVAAKLYYENLLHGKCEAYIDGFYRPDSIPESYREQLIVSAKQYVGQMKKDHQGLVSVEAVGARTDTAKHVGEAYLLLGFGDKTKEEVVVPLVLHDGNWMLR
jgi:hypothetical protein